MFEDHDDLKNKSRTTRALALNSPEANPAENSNDVAVWRLNDVELAKVAGEIGDIDTMLFTAMQVTEEHTRNSRGYLHFLAASISTMCVDVSSVGKYENVALQGMTHYVSVGRGKVAMPSDAEAKAFNAKVRKLWRETIVPYRQQITQEIIKCLDDQEYAVSANWHRLWQVTTGSNASILVLDESIARQLVEELTGMMRAVAKETRAALCDRLRALL